MSIEIRLGFSPTLTTIFFSIDQNIPLTYAEYVSYLINKNNNGSKNNKSISINKFHKSLTEYGSEDNYVVSSDSMNDGDIHKTYC